MAPSIARTFSQHGLVPALAAVLFALSFPASGQVASLTNHSRAAEALLAQGDTSFRQGQYDAAIIEYTHAIQLEPDFAEAYNNRGQDVELQVPSRAVLATPAHGFEQALDSRIGVHNGTRLLVVAS